MRRQLGAGSYGAVYEAYDRTRETTVALKVLTELEPSSLYDFKKEFRRLSGLAHPNLVTLHELFQEAGRWFFTMELVRGEDLLSFVRPGGALDPARCLAAFRQLAEGVHALHRGGRLHRDLKPKNVIVAADGRVVLLDFGFVAQLGRRWDRSVEAGVAGTAAYMAPELVRQLPFSPGSDWYAVGVMLYQALAGRLPFDGGPLEVLRAKLTRPAPPLEGHAEAHPPGLAELCMALLDRRPDARPAPEEILRRLGAAADAVPASDDPAAGPRARLLGRAGELEALRQALARTREGLPVTVRVRGGAGIGKTALAEGFLDRLGAAEMAVCLRARGSTRETVPAQALDALVDALGRHLLRLGEGAAAVLPAGVGALVARFPALARVPAVAAAVAPGGDPVAADPDLPGRALVALKGCLRAVANAVPLVVCVDDYQGCDDESRAAFESLVAAPDPPALLLVTCTRTEPKNDPSARAGDPSAEAGDPPCEGAGDPSPPSGAESGDGGPLALELGALSSDAIRALARRVGGSGARGADAGEHADAADAWLDAVIREAAGSPFLAIELAQAGRCDRRFRPRASAGSCSTTRTPRRRGSRSWWTGCPGRCPRWSTGSSPRSPRRGSRARTSSSPRSTRCSGASSPRCPRRRWPLRGKRRENRPQHRGKSRRGSPRLRWSLRRRGSRGARRTVQRRRTAQRRKTVRRAGSAS